MDTLTTGQIFAELYRRQDLHNQGKADPRWEHLFPWNLCETDIPYQERVRICDVAASRHVKRRPVAVQPGGDPS